MASHESRKKDSIGNGMFLCFNFPLDIGVVDIKNENVGLSFYVIFNYEFIIFNFVCIIFYIYSGAIIGDGDRKRAPFLVLGLAP